MRKEIFAVLLVAGLIATPLPGFAQTSQPPAPAATTATKAKKPPTAGQLAARERQRKCAAEWKGAKAAGKIEKGMKWPQYWSACNKRLKSGT